MSASNEQTQTYTKSRDIIDIGKQVGIDLAGSRYFCESVYEHPCPTKC
ncbi:MAG: hypothetical protein WC856_10815 [Methylococcaceae bacterium]|jgi:hypothetical protein